MPFGKSALPGRQLVLWCSVDQAICLRLGAPRDTGRKCPHGAFGASSVVQVVAHWADQMRWAQALGTSELQTLFNSVNAMCGIGLLATPFALAEMGWLALVLMLGEPACSCLQQSLDNVVSWCGSGMHVPFYAHRCFHVQQAEAAAAKEGPCS